jgi:hypothetical protein
VNAILLECCARGSSASAASATMIVHLSTSGRMQNLEVVLQQLRQERARAQSDLELLDQAISVLEGSSMLRSGGGVRTMSTDARGRIAEAQRRRWAKVKGQTSTARKRTLSPAARKKIAAAQKARWAKFRANKKH